MVLNLLRRTDQGDVSNGCIGDILDGVGSFGCEPVDDLTGFGLAFADIALQQTLDLGYMAVGFLQVSFKSCNQFGIRGLLDKVGRAFVIFCSISSAFFRLLK